MERITRRFWTWAVSALAVCVILGAVVSGLFQLAVLALPSYRQDLSAWVTDVAGRPVQIGGVTLVWRGVTPRLDLSDITLYDDEGDEALSAERLSLGFSLPGLITGEWLPNRVELAGLSVAVDVDADGHVSVAGIETLPEGQQPRKNELFAALRRFKRVRLENCEVRLTHAKLGTQPIQYTIVQADVDRTGDGFEADGELKLPSTHGGKVTFSADIAGDVAVPRSWDGEFEVDAPGLQAQAWLEPWLEPGTRAAAQALELHLAGRLADGRFESIELKGQSDAFVVARSDRRAGAESMKLVATLGEEADGWHAAITQLLLDDEEQALATARVTRDAEGALQVDADAQMLRLTRLAPFLGFVRDAPPGLLVAARSSGEIDHAVLRLRPGGHYSMKGELKDVALKPDETFGFSGMNAQLSADEGGGRLALDGSGVNLQLPRALAVPVPFAALGGEAKWTRAAEGWRVSMPAFTWQLEGTSGKGSVALLLPDDAERSADIDLLANFSAADVTKLKPYMPINWGPGLHAWLDRAIERGRVPHATLAIKGPLRDFPFDHAASGEWKLDIDTAGVRLAYLPDWPGVDDIAAHLTFTGNALAIETTQASVLGNPVQIARANFADFADHLLTVDAQVVGETARFYQFLRASPLKRTLAGLVNNTSASGPSSVLLHLDIPLSEARDTEVNGTVGMQGVELYYKGLDQPISGITGDIAFTGHGLSGHGLTAQFEDLALEAAIEPREGLTAVVTGKFLLSPQPDGSGASAYIPGFLRPALQGQSRWRAELPIGGADSALTLSSDLAGTAIRLPAPLGKSAEASAPIRVSIGGDATAPVRVRVAYAGQLGADIVLAGGEGGVPLKPRSVSLQFGSDAPPPPQAEGIRIGGEVADLDFAAWIAALKSGGADDALGGMQVRAAELSATHLALGGQTFAATRLKFVPGGEGWRMQLEGEGAQGELTWAQAGGGRIGAKLDHVNLEMHGMSTKSDKPEDGAGAESHAPAEPATDPSTLPVIDVDCTHFVAGGADLGHLQLRTSRVPDGQKIELLRLEGGKLDATVSGSWRRAAGKSSADTHFDLSSTDIAAALRAFDYSPTLSAKESHFTGDLKWSDAAGGIDWAQAAGHIGIDVHNGVLKTVEPGAGRVLGLINFYALPRRLTLDFRDVVSTGLSFDKITGGFDLADGVASTPDLKIEAPSLRMEMRGRVGLAARDYDQQVTVYPDISAGVTLGAALLGGPALGALVLLAQTVLDKPLDQVTQMSYHLTGTWDNPKVEKVSKEGNEPKDRLPPLAPLGQKG